MLLSRDLAMQPTWSDRNIMMKKPVFIINLILVILEVIALIHDIYVFGAGLFVWYTIDSNVLQLLVSAVILMTLCRGREISKKLTAIHFVSAVGLTVTFLIAAFVLAPEGGIAYYFLENVAPINHLIAPLLSVLSLLFLEKSELPGKTVIFLPASATMLYGLICLFLNAVRLIDGPYFFLQVYDQPASVIVMWFAIIAVLCIGLAALYRVIRVRMQKR